MDRQWTGRDATALRYALRMTSETFATHLGVAPRTVKAWAAHPTVSPRPAIQDALDHALHEATPDAQTRFHTATGQSHGPQLLRVAMAIIVDEGAVLLTCRRDSATSGIKYGFPAGVVKPGDNPSDVAVRETLAETGVHVTAQQLIGERLHPVTNVACTYWLCGYLGGVLTNQQPDENLSLTWVPIPALGKFIPLDTIYPPALSVLEAHVEQRVERVR